MAITSVKRKLKKRRKRSDQRNALLKRAKMGSYTQPTNEQLAALGVAPRNVASDEEE